MARLLYLYPGPMPPPADPERSVFTHYGDPDRHTIDVLCPVWWSSIEEGRAAYPGSDFPVVQCGRTTYHLFLENRFPSFLRSLARIGFFLGTARRLSRDGPPIDLIICYGTNTVGLCSLLISKWCGARLVPEIPGVPSKAFVLDAPLPGIKSRCRKWIATILLRAVLRQASGVHMLFPGQVEESLLAPVRIRRISHSFVPVSKMQSTGIDDRYILFLGFPWYLKGVDLLIAAFRRITSSVPDIRLRLVGHFPDREHLVQLAGGEPRISIENPVRAQAAFELISRCTVLVLPSRTEAMGRVLLEAMAARKPVVASRVDGIPHYVRHEKNGLLFECGDAEDLKRQLLRVVTDPALAARLGDTGYRLIQDRWTEAHFRKVWEEIIDAVTALPRGAS